MNAMQVLNCFSLGSYKAIVVKGRLKVRGPLPMAGKLPGGVRGNRDEIVQFLEEYCGGVWPPARDSEFFYKEGAA